MGSSVRANAAVIAACLAAACGGQVNDSGGDDATADSPASPDSFVTMPDFGPIDSTFIDVEAAPLDSSADSSADDGVVDSAPDSKLPCDAPDAGDCNVVVEVGDGGAILKPGTVYVNAGGTVTWHFNTSGHNIVSGASCTADGEFCSPSDTGCATAPTMPLGSKYSHRFTKRGATYEYFSAPFCVSAAMKGVVKVWP